MGYVPIIIAMLAFVLLLILVNLNSIHARQKSLGLAIFSVCQTAKSRNALLKRLRGVHANLVCPKLPKDHRLIVVLIPQMTSFINAEWKSLEDASYYLNETKPTPELIRYKKALEVLNHRQRINLRTFERKVREYNLLVNSYPTAMVASLYRIKPIKLSSVR